MWPQHVGREVLKAPCGFESEVSILHEIGD